MKLELKENMYVRTKDGYISQYKYYDYDIGEGLIGKLLCIPLSNGTFANIENIKKFSYNIVDILKKGDYVNGSKVIDISIIGKDKEKWVWVEQMEDTDNKYGDDYVGYNNEQIKSIVTKEQFEQITYKVGE